jgi:hypothetical protein
VIVIARHEVPKQSQRKLLMHVCIVKLFSHEINTKIIKLINVNEIIIIIIFFLTKEIFFYNIWCKVIDLGFQ